MELHAIIKGRVQGVGFRAAAAKHAKKLNLKGAVRNLPDESVEIYAQGSQKNLEQLLENLEKEFAGYVQLIETDFDQPLRNYVDFRIVE
jgi:acylphosphatase